MIALRAAAARLRPCVRDGMRATVVRAWIALVVALSPWPSHAHADSDAYRERSIREYHHTAWTVRQGAPGQITALAQSRDGFLWLATQSGLFRFDGIDFERMAPTGADAFPTESVAALYAPPSGGVWVGLRYGVVSFVADNGSVRHYDEDDGLPTGSVYGFAQDRDGTVWAATFQGLARFDGTRWHRLPADDGPPGAQARSVFVDRDGTLWVATDTTLARRTHGARAFDALDIAVGRISQIAQSSDGTLWIAEADGAVRPVWRADGASFPDTRLATASAGVLFDRHGALWATSLGNGIHRIAYPERADMPAQRFGEDDGLTSDYLWPALEDREGNVWFGTSRGLDRFRRSNVVPVAVPDGSYDFTIAAGDSGSLWVGTKGRPLLRLQRDGAAQTSAPDGITAALRTPGGELLLGGPHGLWMRDAASDAAPRLLAALPPEVGHSGVQAIARAPDGATWLSLNRPGVFVWQDGTWTSRHDDAFPTGSSPLALLSDNDGTMWLGFARNVLVRMRGDSGDRFDLANGLDIGNVTALARAAGVLWIGGERGVAWHDGERLHPVSSSADGPLLGVTGIVAANDGSLWFNGSRGIVRLAPGQVASLLDGSAQPPVTDVFGVLDGVPGTPAQFRPLPTAVQGTDGRLWFATTSGIVWIDPARILRNPLPPPVTIRGVLVDGQRVDASVPLQLPTDSTRMEIDYTALSLAVPERVQFRYRLDGLDTQWQPVGAHRSAFYTNPGPGHYTFRVQAANDDGVWNDTGATLAFAVAPRFHQTTWFALLCAAAVLVLLRFFHLRRMAQLAAGLRARMQERHDERERIARELHDTLLQGFQGLILRLQGVADRMRNDDPLRDSMERALDRAEDVLVEGRDRVFELRNADTQSLDLLDALRDVCATVAGDATARHRVGVLGRPEPLDPLVQEEVVCITREAVINAFRHAQATLVDVEISYTRRALRVSVRDDGQGIDADVLDRGGRAGHWGLPGMRERAARIGAQVQIISKSGVGTDVIVHLPGSLAFRRKRRSLRDRLGLRRRG